MTIWSCGGTGNGQDPVEQSAPFISAAALNGEQAISLTVDLSGAQSLPPMDSRATGRARLVFDTQTRQLYASLDTSIEVPLAVQIHEGGPGEVGAVVATMQRHQNGQYSLPKSTFLTKSQAALFTSGSLYIKVRAADDEIRAQISPVEIQSVTLPVLSDIQAKVFTPLCSGCHTGGGNTLPSVLNLTSRQASFSSLVGTYSVSVEGLLRVDPGDFAASLLVQKITGTHTVGSRMPFRGSKLDDQMIEAVEQWIMQGALF